MDTTNAYRDGRVRITRALREADPAIGQQTAAACPEWTVKDVVAHLCGINADILAGNLDGVATNAWTAAQVVARRDRTLAEVLDEWDDVGPKVEAALAGGQAPAQMVFDLACHEHDLRQALEIGGARDADSTRIAFDFALDGFALTFPADLPALRVNAADRSVELGSGEPEAVLVLDRFEALRALTGRRSARQIAAYDWDGADPDRWLPAFTWGPFTVRAEDLVE